MFSPNTIMVKCVLATGGSLLSNQAFEIITYFIIKNYVKNVV
jgi:hypothetical protein